MKERKLVLRTCVCSKEVCEKKDLFRIVRTPEKNVIIDLKGKANGRGAYLKKDKDIILLAQKTKVLDKKLEVDVPQNIYEELLGLLNE
ncbi:TPA: YlxR family protein [Candidatus Avacholeplasma faecigallinarum]|nr:YlxR family protein [Candidatus Avacholeplasma faecigallinarum]